MEPLQVETPEKPKVEEKELQKRSETMGLPVIVWERNKGRDVFVFFPALGETEYEIAHKLGIHRFFTKHLDSCWSKFLAPMAKLVAPFLCCSLFLRSAGHCRDIIVLDEIWGFPQKLLTVVMVAGSPAACRFRELFFEHLLVFYHCYGAELSKSLQHYHLTVDGCKPAPVDWLLYVSIKDLQHSILTGGRLAINCSRWRFQSLSIFTPKLGEGFPFWRICSSWVAQPPPNSVSRQFDIKF